MLFMVIERFKDRDPIPIYKRVRDSGIKFPEALTYVGETREVVAPFLDSKKY
jgi:hypothetical protein